MLQTARARVAAQRENGEGGFTLIELMVVVLIIAILLAIAIPTFLGAQNKANDRDAQSSLRNTLTNAKAIFSDSQDYTKATTTELGNSEPGLSYVLDATGSTAAKMVSVATSTSQIIIAAHSKSGQCFYIKDVAGSASQFGKASGTTCKTTDTVTYGASW